MEIDCKRHKLRRYVFDLNFKWKYLWNCENFPPDKVLSFQRKHVHASIKSASKWLLWFERANPLSIRMCIKSYSYPAFVKNSQSISVLLAFDAIETICTVALETFAAKFFAQMKSYRWSSFAQSVCIINCFAVWFQCIQDQLPYAYVHTCYLIPLNVIPAYRHSCHFTTSHFAYFIWTFS